MPKLGNMIRGRDACFKDGEGYEKFEIEGLTKSEQNLYISPSGYYPKG